MSNGIPPGGTTPPIDPHFSSTAVAPRLADPWIGSQLKNRYAIAGKLGQGGMGIVYLAEDLTLKRVVAIKRVAQALTNESRGLQRFLREAQAAARLQHANVVAIYDIDSIDGEHFFVMEFVPGPTAAQIIQRDGGLHWQAATKIAIEACRGLAAAHQAKLIHRDVKPANILVSRTGDVKLGDFGLAKTVSEEQSAITHSNQTVGTPQFMSPEQVKNEDVDERTDIYSLGAAYYTLLTGEPPFKADGWYATMYAHTSLPVPDPRGRKPAVPEACAKIVARAMAKRRADRFPDAQAMLAALEAALGTANVDLAPIAETFDVPDLATTLKGIALKPKTWRLPKSWIWLSALAGAFLFLGGLSLVCSGVIAYRWFFPGIVRPAVDDIEQVRNDLAKRNPRWDGKFAESQMRDKRIVKLTLRVDHITDITPLADLLDLEELTLNVNQGMETKTTLKDIEPLRKLTKLNYLKLAGFPVKNIDALRAIKELRSFHMSDTQVKDLTPLEGHPIVSLRISGTPVENLRGLEKSKLEILQADYSYNLVSLEGMPTKRIKHVGINSTLVPSLDALKNADQLEYLDIRSANVTLEQRKVEPPRSLRPEDMRVIMDRPQLQHLFGEFTPSETAMLREHFRARNQAIEIKSEMKRKIP